MCGATITIFRAEFASRFSSTQPHRSAPSDGVFAFAKTPYFSDEPLWEILTPNFGLNSMTELATLTPRETRRGRD